ncbi:MAG: hypothetical protein NXH91_15800 [Phyllobacteriaceae bacterium]|nr:hypothetical protein [Phyllobacteriaceae bacterium]
MKLLLAAAGLFVAGTVFIGMGSVTGSGAAMAQATGPLCQPYSITTYGQSAAALKKARERRAKRRAIRRWERAVEGRLLGARGIAVPDAGTDYSNLSNAQVHSFNCSGRPLNCVLVATPCRAS